jgi:signal transduction histidine kinase
LQNGTIPFHPVEFNVQEHISILLPLLKENAKQKDINIIHDDKNDVIVCADRTMINSVLQNLLTNAIKFTNPKGTVAINYEDKGNKIQVKISDNGIGMDDKTLKDLFKIHKHSTTKGTANEKGTGLGLILSKEFIEKHNGELRIDSEKGIGTTFCFTLPKNPDNGTY